MKTSKKIQDAFKKVKSENPEFTSLVALSVVCEWNDLGCSEKRQALLDLVNPREYEWDDCYYAHVCAEDKEFESIFPTLQEHNEYEVIALTDFLGTEEKKEYFSEEDCRLIDDCLKLKTLENGPTKKTVKKDKE